MSLREHEDELEKETKKTQVVILEINKAKAIMKALLSSTSLTSLFEGYFTKYMQDKPLELSEALSATYNKMFSLDQRKEFGSLLSKTNISLCFTDVSPVVDIEIVRADKLIYSFSKLKKEENFIDLITSNNIVVKDDAIKLLGNKADDILNELDVLFGCILLEILKDIQESKLKEARKMLTRTSNWG